MSVHIHLQTIAYASIAYFRNGRSVIWKLSVTSDRALEDVRVEIFYAPDYVEPEVWHIGYLEAGASVPYRIKRVEYDAEELLNIRDEEQGCILVRVMNGDEIVAEKKESFIWLAFNAWPGGDFYMEMLASFVLPEDRFVNAIVQDIRRIMKADDEGFPGYEDESSVLAAVNAMWNALIQRKIKYNLPPKDSYRTEGVGQRIRIPSIIQQEQCSTCLDSTLLIASILIRLGLNPLLFITKDHAFVGVWMEDRRLDAPTMPMVGTIRNYVRQRDILPIEATIMTPSEDSEDEGNLPLDMAASSALHTISTMKDGDFFITVDVRRTWAELGIRPVFGGRGESGPKRIYMTVKGGEKKTVSKPEQWQRRQLNLSTSNPLLNRSAGGKRGGCLQLHVPNVAMLEDLLSLGSVFTLKGLSSSVWNNEETRQSMDREVCEAALRENADHMFRRGELLLRMTPAKLNSALSSLYKAARREEEETGVNALFIACGFLKWNDVNHTTDGRYEAPVLLIPVRISRKSARSGFRIMSTEDETRINATLLEHLRQNYGISIPELEGDLPTDEHGVDVDYIFGCLRSAISGLTGWEVSDTCAIGLFSFARYLMWRDLKEKQHLLMRSPIVRQIAGSDETTCLPNDFPDPKRLDSELTLRDLYVPLDADSSQLTAILSAEQGKSFVLVGPPGTGKSQTIANMITHCLAHGKRVLFVAEKAVALEAVAKKLRQIGVAPFCLELHSGKAGRRRVLDSLNEALQLAGQKLPSVPWDLRNYELEKLRYELDMLPYELHRPTPDGESVFHHICLATQHADLPHFTPIDGEPGNRSAESIRELAACARELEQHFIPVADLMPGCAEDLKATEYTSTREENLARTLEEFIKQAGKSEAGATLRHAAGAEGMAPEVLRELAELVTEASGRDLSPLFPEAAGKTLGALRLLVEHAAECRRLRSILSLPYPETAFSAPELPELQRIWVESRLANFITRSLKTKRVEKGLQALAGCREKPDCQKDLETLMALAKQTEALNRVAQELPPPLHDGAHTTAEHLAEAEKWAERLATLIQKEPEAEMVLHNLASPNSEAHRALVAWTAEQEKLTPLLRRLDALLGCSPAAARGLSNTPPAQWARELLSLRHRWHDIVLWNETARSSGERGTRLIEALVRCRVPAGTFESACRVNLSRQMIRYMLDTNPTLNRFSTPLYETKLREFAEKDAEVRKLCREQVRMLLASRAAQALQHGEELQLLRRESTKQKEKDILPIRRLLDSIPHILPLLKPCLMMSPISVAQYLAAESEPFDLVIFDEASQIPVCDAICALGRAQSAVIVGDPKQMPPTGFFNAADGETDDPERDRESILDECLACNIPEKQITWHYRSKSESLIAFSNQHYYEGKLTTFPAPVAGDAALVYHPVNGTYRSADHTNEQEAAALVAHVLAVLKAPGFEYNEDTSIGIVTFNSQQQALIEDMLEKARSKDSELEPYFSEDNKDAVFVKNLENVQGDERGVIYFSTTFGPDEHGKVQQNFGPLNQSGGERRLNVAITRARSRMHVFTSLPGVSPTVKARGGQDLGSFLRFARLCSGNTPDNTEIVKQAKTNHMIDSLAADLSALGWTVRTNSGASQYKLDITVLRRDEPDFMLAAIETDGENYASAATARDRIVQRSGILRHLGWNVLRVWSVDWWRNREACVQALHEQLLALEKEGITPAQAKLRQDMAEPTPEPPAPDSATAKPASPGLQGKAEPYEYYLPQAPLPYLFEMSPGTMKQEIMNLVYIEGPVCEHYLYSRLAKLSHSSAPRKLDTAIRALLKAEQLVMDEIEVNSEICCVLRLPDQPAVRLRTKGDRKAEDIPPNELQELLQLARTSLGTEAATDEILKASCTYIGARFTKNMKAYLETLLPQTEKETETPRVE